MALRGREEGVALGQKRTGSGAREERCKAKALFRCKKFLDFDTVVFLFLFDKYCLIME